MGFMFPTHTNTVHSFFLSLGTDAEEVNLEPLKFFCDAETRLMGLQDQMASPYLLKDFTSSASRLRSPLASQGRYGAMRSTRPSYLCLSRAAISSRGPATA